MKKTNLRKIILLTADIVLLAVCIIQLILVSRDSVKSFKLKETPDKIYIYNQGQEVNLYYENEQWVVGDEKVQANQFMIQNFLDALSNIRAIEKVGTVKNEVYIERYELDENKCISVAVSKNNQIIRSVQIGKNSSDWHQNYGTVDGDKNIYLLSGSLRTIFSVTEDDVKAASSEERLSLDDFQLIQDNTEQVVIE